MKKTAKRCEAGLLPAFFVSACAAVPLCGLQVACVSSSAALPAPEQLMVPSAATTYASISLLWDKPAAYHAITGYNIYQNGALVATTAADHTYYTAENLEPDTAYTFEVCTVKGKAESQGTQLIARTDKKGTVRDVTQAPYNAAGDGKTLDTAAIQAAINDCAPYDIVLIPENRVFLTGALDLKSDMTLEVNGTLLSSANPADFEKPATAASTVYSGGSATGVVYTAEAPKRLIWSRIEGWEQYCYRSLINIGSLDEATDYSAGAHYVCHNVKICGTGTITGDAGKIHYAPIKGNATALAVAEGNSADRFYDLSASVTSENNIRSRIRGRLINVSNAQNVYIKGITVAKPPMWTIHMIYSDSITTNGVTFETRGYRNGDGWDPDSSTNCTIYDCMFNTGDDCIAIKSGKNPEGNNPMIPAKNIRIIGCKSEGGLGLAVGSEMSGGVESVYVRDCVLSNTRYGIELKASKVRGGYIKDFHVQDCTVDRILVHSVTYNADGDPAATSPVFSDMTFRNMQVLGFNGYDHTWLSKSIEIEGFTSNPGNDAHYVQNLTFEDITLGTSNNVQQEISLKYTRNISFNRVVQSDKKAPAVTAKDSIYTVNGKPGVR